MSHQNANVIRFGRDLDSGRQTTARVAITQESGTARVLLEVDADERVSAVLRLHPDDVRTLGEALWAAAQAMHGERERFPMKHSAR